MDIVNSAVEQYLTDLVPARDPALAAVEDAARANHVPMVGPYEGNVLYLIARMARVKNVLEVGSATGYSAIWLARAAKEQGGTFTGLELDPKRHAEAERNLAAAGLSGTARIIHGDALEILPTLNGPYDLIFVDIVRQLGEETSLKRVLDLAVARVAVGGILAFDNILHGGEAITGSTTGGRAANALNQAIAKDPRLVSTFLSVRDGVAVALRVS